VVLVTHRSAALAQADKLLVMNDGRVQAFGPARDILQALGQGTAQRPLQAGGGA